MFQTKPNKAHQALELQEVKPTAPPPDAPLINKTNHCMVCAEVICTRHVGGTGYCSHCHPCEHAEPRFYVDSTHEGAQSDIPVAHYHPCRGAAGVCPNVIYHAHALPGAQHPLLCTECQSVSVATFKWRQIISLAITTLLLVGAIAAIPLAYHLAKSSARLGDMAERMTNDLALSAEDTTSELGKIYRFTLNSTAATARNTIKAINTVADTALYAGQRFLNTTTTLVDTAADAVQDVGDMAYTAESFAEHQLRAAAWRLECLIIDRATCELNYQLKYHLCPTETYILKTGEVATLHKPCIHNDRIIWTHETTAWAEARANELLATVAKWTDPAVFEHNVEAMHVSELNDLFNGNRGMCDGASHAQQLTCFRTRCLDTDDRGLTGTDFLDCAWWTYVHHDMSVVPPYYRELRPLAQTDDRTPLRKLATPKRLLNANQEFVDYLQRTQGQSLADLEASLPPMK